MNSKTRGIIVPAVTPLTSDLKIDKAGTTRLLNYLVEGGVNGIFILGTTGEAVNLTFELKCLFVKQTIATLKDRVNLYVGISHTSIPEILNLERFCSSLGVKTVVVHPPYFYPLTDQELKAFYQNILDSTTSDIMLYNMPAMTKIDISIELIEELSEHPKVIGLKDSSKDIDRLKRLNDIFLKREDFSLLAGVSLFALRGLKMGLSGCVPSLANLEPQLYSQLCKASLNGDSSSSELNEHIAKINDLFQAEKTAGKSLAKLKAALEIKGICSRQTALPILPFDETEVKQLRQELEILKVI